MMKLKRKIILTKGQNNGIKLEKKIYYKFGLNGEIKNK